MRRRGPRVPREQRELRQLRPVLAEVADPAVDDGAGGAAGLGAGCDERGPEAVGDGGRAGDEDYGAWWDVVDLCVPFNMNIGRSVWMCITHIMRRELGSWIVFGNVFDGICWPDDLGVSGLALGRPQSETG